MAEGTPEIILSDKLGGEVVDALEGFVDRAVDRKLADSPLQAQVAQLLAFRNGTQGKTVLIESRLDSIEKDVQRLREEFSVLRKEFSGVRVDLSSVRNEVLEQGRELRSEMAALRDVIIELHKEMRRATYVFMGGIALIATIFRFVDLPMK